MRIQLIFSLLLFSFVALAVDDKSMNDLFNKYNSLMDQKKIELVDEVFTQKFIKESGGKKELIIKINQLPVVKENKKVAPEINWRKGLKGEIYFAKVKYTSQDKTKKTSQESEFMILKEDGKLKINGTISDDN